MYLNIKRYFTVVKIFFNKFTCDCPDSNIKLHINRVKLWLENPIFLLGFKNHI